MDARVLSIMVGILSSPVEFLFLPNELCSRLELDGVDPNSPGYRAFPQHIFR